MRTVLVAASLAASATTASAGGYIGLGIGTGAASSGETGLDADGRSGHLVLGYRFNPKVGPGTIAVEGLVSRYDMVRSDLHQYTGTTLALAGRYNFPLGNNFELYGRLGIQHTRVEPKVYTEPYSGTGFLIGPGVEYRIPLGSVVLAFFIDYTIQYASTKDETVGVDGLDLLTRMWTLGATIGF